ncbi:hypothetical protein BDN70DRAFT_520649 [Pholiota conissans]|uniref:Uncharacterized protein n=1 Tax=Pholiota conissans TaxID=109636 RepID=A0A9P5YQL8_9AGAR|nr:hypothetical protein BDN70DRAFT_520649 [Pholiota conissans]
MVLHTIFTTLSELDGISEALKLGWLGTEVPILSLNSLLLETRRPRVTSSAYSFTSPWEGYHTATPTFLAFFLDSAHRKHSLCCANLRVPLSTDLITPPPHTEKAACVLHVPWDLSLSSLHAHTERGVRLFSPMFFESTAPLLFSTISIQTSIR